MANKVAIIGAGAAGLMAADRLSALKPEAEIVLYDAMPSPARKILMAGKSGLNITHSEGLEDLAQFSSRYGSAGDWMLSLLQEFGPKEVVSWMAALGQDTYIGSSGRVFPKVMKASPLIRALMHRLAESGVQFEPRYRWQGWDSNGLLDFQTEQGTQTREADATLLTMGGPSWPRLGTDGSFLSHLEGKGLTTRPYRAANCGFDADWSQGFIEKQAGEPIKSVKLSFEGQSIQGDFVMTRHGVEGSAIYGLSAPLRDKIELVGTAVLKIDLRPHQSVEQLEGKLARPRGKQSMSNFLRKAINLKGAQAALLRECTDREVMTDPARLARALKNLPLVLTSPRPIHEAISTAGGVGLQELDDGMMARSVPGLFLAGEMLDWEAPTGGYLLTGCLSQGYRAAKGIADYLEG